MNPELKRYLDRILEQLEAIRKHLESIDTEGVVTYPGDDNG